MTDSELHEIENHISRGWHDRKGNDDVQLLFDEVKRLRTVVAEAREHGIEAMREELCECETHQPPCYTCEKAERLKRQG